jgi:hypothetical protein
MSLFAKKYLYVGKEVFLTTKDTKNSGRGIFATEFTEGTEWGGGEDEGILQDIQDRQDGHGYAVRGGEQVRADQVKIMCVCVKEIFTG